MLQNTTRESHHVYDKQRCPLSSYLLFLFRLYVQQVHEYEKMQRNGRIIICSYLAHFEKITILANSRVTHLMLERFHTICVELSHWERKTTLESRHSLVEPHIIFLLDVHVAPLNFKSVKTMHGNLFLKKNTLRRYERAGTVYPTTRWGDTFYTITFDTVYETSRYRRWNFNIFF